METAAASEETELLGRARADAASILSAAERDVATARARLLHEAAASARSARSQLEAEAQLQIEAQRARARDALVETAFARAAEILQASRHSPEYASAMEALFQEARAQFPPDRPLTIRCDPRDLAAVEGMLPAQSDMSTVDPSLVCWGGLQVTDRNGRIVCDNTLEQRLERAREALRWHVAAKVLGTRDMRPPGV